VDVNAESEQDLELLDEYLDGALAPQDAKHLRGRIEEDSALAAALDELRAQREVRAAVWIALEPTESEARRFANKVLTEVRRRSLWSRVGHYSGFGSAAAACLLIGFFMGWAGRDGAPAGGLPPTFEQSGVNVSAERPTVTAAYPGTLGVLINEIRYNEPSHRSKPMLVIRRIIPGSVAARSDLHEGDLLLSLDGDRLHDVPSLVAALANRRGQRLLRILRDGQVHEIAIELHQQP
jgi:hypothetical protein